jgi:hypothetical protein
VTHVGELLRAIERGEGNALRRARLERLLPPG